MSDSWVLGDGLDLTMEFLQEAVCRVEVVASNLFPDSFQVIRRRRRDEVRH